MRPQGGVWKRIAVAFGTALVVVPVLVAAYAIFMAQRADFAWNPSVAKPLFKATHPRVVIDEAHYNASTAGVTGRYWPFARLLQADGYDVRKGTEAFSPEGLDGVNVLVIANASGAPKPQFLGINLPVRTTKERADPAFTDAEVQTLRAWVERGGSLLLIADHAPFGAAAQALAAVFGVAMHQGFAEVPNERSDSLVFSSDNHRLGDHPILSGDGPGTAVRRVMTFTGQSLDGPAEAAVLLRLPASAIEYVPVGDSLAPRPAGMAQGLAFAWGKGRVVVLGEAGMLTAQVSDGKPFGMNSPGNDNRQLALNVMHWLSGRL